MMIYLAPPNVKSKDGSGVLPELVGSLWDHRGLLSSAISAQANAELNDRIRKCKVNSKHGWW